MTAIAPPLESASDGVADQPLDLNTKPSLADRVFNGVLASGAGLTFLILAAVVLFLCIRGLPTIGPAGWGLFTSVTWNPDAGQYGMLPLLVGSATIAIIAVVVATPVSLATALMINEYAPRQFKPVLTWVIDLLATVPSIVYGFWGLLLISPAQEGPARWLAAHFGFVPFLRTPTPGQYVHSIMVVGLICAVTVVPIITSITRDVMAQAPRDVCEAALGLGSTRWGMVTDVILPFSRQGILGAVLLGFGRGLGETMIPVIVLSSHNILTSSILGPNGMGTIAKEITEHFVTASPKTQGGLLLLALILLTAAVGLTAVARGVVARSTRSMS